MTIVYLDGFDKTVSQVTYNPTNNGSFSFTAPTGRHIRSMDCYAYDYVFMDNFSFGAL